ncbi:hypothetical protein LWI28_012441 [Acer negundo]|uniref:Uncharacterized protein n=1 Tax=Acer negundo TaxID=4023 RepID=A0AAD5J4F8_ACENE|nr:hypothetical protein LWI28_012441 [Acer negundo]
MATAMVEDTFEDDQLFSATTDDIVLASSLLDNEISVLKVLKYICKCADHDLLSRSCRAFSSEFCILLYVSLAKMILFWGPQNGSARTEPYLDDVVRAYLGQLDPYYLTVSLRIRDDEFAVVVVETELGARPGG